MSILRRAILALTLIAGIAPAIAQVPPPVPALPDTERRTSYQITASTCACSVNFALYGDSTDYQNWVEVWLNNVNVAYNDPSFGWVLTSPTGPLANIARPITDAVITFNSAQTGTVQIVGARRPRRVSQFSENRGVAARDLNQVLTDIIAQNRETWDKTNDVTGRGVFGLPGETMKPLPPAASRANQGACFDSGGSLISCVSVPTGTFAAGSGITFTGTNPTTISANTAAMSIANGHLLANATGGNAPASDTAPSTWFDQAYCSTVGFFLVRLTGAWTCSSSIAVQISWYGAACNAILVSSGTVSIASGSASLTVTAATFGSGDVGKSIWVPGAGVSGAGLSTTIAGFTNTTTVTLSVAASTTVTAATLTQANIIAYGTDDTASIQAAITATPNFGTLFINPVSLGFPAVGCLIKQIGSTGVALVVNHPINILGGGNLSALVTDPSMGTAVGGIHALQNGLNWNGVVWQGFTLGTNINFVPFTRYGAQGIYFDATTGGPGGFLGVTVTNLRLGESAGSFSLMMDGVGSQGNRFINNTIWGGLELNNVIDSNIVDMNRFQGASVFGVNVIMTGGNFQFTHNSVTAAGGFCIAAATGGILMPLIHDNYFEENALTPPQFQHNSFVDIGCSAGVSTIVGAQIHDNIIANIVSSTTTAIKTDPSTASTTILNNFIANNTARTAVLNNGTSTNCGPNHFQTSTTLTNGSGTFANACSSY